MIKPRANKNRVEVFVDKPGWEYQVFVDGEFFIGCDYEDDAEATKHRIIAVLDKTVEMCCSAADCRKMNSESTFVSLARVLHTIRQEMGVPKSR